MRIKDLLPETGIMSESKRLPGKNPLNSIYYDIRKAEVSRLLEINEHDGLRGYYDREYHEMFVSSSRSHHHADIFDIAGRHGMIQCHDGFEFCIAKSLLQLNHMEWDLPEREGTAYMLADHHPWFIVTHFSHQMKTAMTKFEKTFGKLVEITRDNRDQVLFESICE
jgi:hypothetical protein